MLLPQATLANEHRSHILGYGSLPKTDLHSPAHSVLQVLGIYVITGLTVNIELLP